MDTYVSGVLASLGCGAPRGVVLHGPPGCGKTSLARALAADLAPRGVKFLNVSCTGLVRAEVGSSERALAEVFAAARRAAPCLLLLDQIEVIAGRRQDPSSSSGDGGSGGGAGGGGGSAENTMDRILSLLLVEIDGTLTEPNSGGGGGGGGNGAVVVMAATGDICLVEPALLRPGRLDQHIELRLPDEAGRREILTALLEAMPLDLGGERRGSELSDGGGAVGEAPPATAVAVIPSVLSAAATEAGNGGGFASAEELRRWVARETPGWSGADLERLCQEAAMACLRRTLPSGAPSSAQSSGGPPPSRPSRLAVGPADFRYALMGGKPPSAASAAAAGLPLPSGATPAPSPAWENPGHSPQPAPAVPLFGFALAPPSTFSEPFQFQPVGRGAKK